MIEKIAKMRKCQWQILEYYNYRLPDIQRFIKRAKQLDLRSDLVQYLIFSLEIWVDFYTHLPESYEGYEEIEVMA